MIGDESFLPEHIQLIYAGLAIGQVHALNDFSHEVFFIVDGLLMTNS